MRHRRGSRSSPRRGSRRVRARPRSGLGHGTRRGDRVELVRVVEHGRLGGARRAGVVVAGDRVQQLGAGCRVEPVGALLDQAQAEMDVAEQAPLLGEPVRRGGAELERAADVVQERGGEEQVGAESRMELRRLAAERGDADGVLEQAAGVAVVPVRGRGQPAQPRRGSRRRRGSGRPSRAGRGARSRRRGTRGTRRARPRRGASRARARRRPRPGAASSERISSWSRSRNRSTRPSTCTASPSANRASSRSTSDQTRASIRPLGSTSSSARYGAPPRVRSRCLRETA